MSNPIESLRAALSQASLLSASTQSGLMDELNASVSKLSPYLDPAQALVDHFWKEQAPTEDALPAIRWTRWTGLQGDSGLATLLQTPKGRILVLPPQVDPPCLTLQDEAPEMWLCLLPEYRTAQRYGSTKLIYTKVPSLTVPTYWDRFGKGYEKYLHQRYSPASRVPPSACLKDDGSLLLEDRQDSLYRAVAAAQLGFQYLLCRVVPPFAAPSETLTVGALTVSFPSIQALRPAMKSSGKIPPTRYFGGGHPESGLMPIEISGSMKLYNDRDIPIGEAQILAGGAEGLIEFPEFDFSAHTSQGEAVNEGEETRNQEDGCLIGHFQLPELPRGFVAAGFDGLGGAPRGEAAQSAGLQGVHAGLVATLTEGRVPDPRELFEAAARAADAQVEQLEKSQGKKFDPHDQPNAVGCIIVIIGDLLLIATTGDFPVMVSEQRPDGSVETVAYTNADVNPEYYITSSLRSRNARFYARKLAPKTKTKVTSFSDGALHNIVGDFKIGMSQEIRAAQEAPLPDRSFFHNLDSLLATTPSNRLSQVLLNVALKGIDPDEYPNLIPVERHHDNLTGMTIYIDNPEPSGLEIPPGYREMERVTNAHQYHYEVVPTVLYMPDPMTETYLGSSDHPEGKTMMVVPNAGLAPVHARFFRDNDAYFVELAAPDREIEIRRGEISQRLIKIGEPFSLQSLDTLVLTDTMSVEIQLPDSESNIPTIRPT